jgi:hypothetical protein
MFRSPMTSRRSSSFRAARTPLLAVPLCLALADTALAAEPDGKGPWADQVVSSQIVPGRCGWLRRRRRARDESLRPPSCSGGTADVPSLWPPNARGLQARRELVREVARHLEVPSVSQAKVTPGV